VLFPAEPIATTIISTTVKSTVRLADRHRLIGYAQGGQNREPIRLAGFLFPNTTKNESRESTSSQLAKGLVWKAEWNAVVRNDLFAEIRVGQFVASRAERPNGSSPRVEDSSTLTVSGGHRDWQEDRRNDQVNGALSVVTERLGRHHLKLGGEILRIVDGERWKLGFSGDVVHETQNDVPSQVYLFQTPSHARSGVWLYEAYASDSWQLKRLTLNLGLRFDRYHTFLPEQESYPAVDKLFAWTFVAPRLGASFDLGGNGRTVAKFTYARYWLPPLTAVGFNVNPNQPDRWERWTWSDDNHTGVWERGEEKVLQESHGGTAPISVDPQLRLPYVREVTARVEREVVTGFHVSTGVVWRGERQQGARHSASRRYEDFTVMKSLRDPGPDKEVGTGDDGPDIQVYELRPELLGLSGTIVRNLPHADNDYFSWELTGQRRLHGRWSLLAWFSTTWSRDHASGYLGQNVRANAFPLTPNDFINTDEQGHHRFCMWSARFWATYDGPWGIRVAPFLRHQSGQPFGRTLSTTLNYGTIHVLTEPIGTRRQDHITLFDLQVEKDFLIRSSTRLTAYVDVFNMLNANPEQQISWLTGRSFLRPLSIVPPRIARVGIRLGW
jgi:hypothetical protein